MEQKGFSLVYLMGGDSGDLFQPMKTLVGTTRLGIAEISTGGYSDLISFVDSLKRPAEGQKRSVTGRKLAGSSSPVGHDAQGTREDVVSFQ